MKSAQITIKDLAEALGVSVSTVSRALKDHPDISIKTKVRVQELADRLNYKPNTIALSLRQGRSHIIGIIVPQIVHHFFASIISGIEEFAFKRGYSVIICQSNESYEREVINTQTLISSRADGIIISPTKDTTNFDHFKNIEENKIPITFVDRVCPNITTDKVVIDDYKAAFEATEYLINTGCKKLSHFSGPKNLEISEKRKKGFTDALLANNIAINEHLIISCDNFHDAKAKCNKLLAQNNIPDGIFTVNDLTAAGAISAIKNAGLKVPEQISVVGFTNGEISKITDPPLTTVDQNGFKMGQKATELLISRIEKKTKQPYKTEIIPTKLIIRASTK